MIVEQRTYTLHVGATREFLALYEAEGLQLAVETLGLLVGFYSTEIGPLNRVIHLWGFESLDDRQRRRAELAANPDWQAFAVKLRQFIRDQESIVLIPAPFFTPTGRGAGGAER